MYIPLLAPTPYRILFNVLTNEENNILRLERKGCAVQWSVGEGPVTQTLYDPEMRTVSVRIINVPGAYKAKTVLDSHPVIRELTTDYPIFNGLLSGVHRITQEPYFDMKVLRANTERFIESIDLFQDINTEGSAEIKIQVPEKGTWRYHVFHSGNTEPEDITMKAGETILTVMSDQIVGINVGSALYLLKHQHVHGHLYAAAMNSKKTQQLIKQKNIQIIPITLSR